MVELLTFDLGVVTSSLEVALRGILYEHRLPRALDEIFSSILNYNAFKLL